MAYTPLPDLPDGKYTKVWTTLITNTKYLTGLIALDYSLKLMGSKYPLVALYTDGFTNSMPKNEAHKALDIRGIPKIRIDYIMPSKTKDYSNDPRFYDCFSKLQPFKLIQFERVVQLDSDMIVINNMDELMEISITKSSDNWYFAAAPACVCNPYDKKHYPKDWIPENCSFTKYEQKKQNSLIKNDSQWDMKSPHAKTGLKICNGGLVACDPSLELYQRILDAMNDETKTLNYDFADQSLLSDVFDSQWMSLSYKYNALKTLALFHDDLWNIKEVKNIHYIITPKPWDVTKEEYFDKDETKTFKYWWDINDKRLIYESEKGINDGF